jgi:nephrocystin-3
MLQFIMTKSISSFTFSHITGESLEILRSRKTLEFPIPAIDEKDRRLIVAQILGDYNKKLTYEQTLQLLNKRSASSPLYLVVACEELRIFGIFEQLSRKIMDFPEGILTNDSID